MNMHDINPDLLPILTELADGSVLELPMLTETVVAAPTEMAPAFLLDEQQCRQLAEELFPELESTLRNAIGSRSEAKWEKAMQQVHEALPELIRNAVQETR